MPYVYLYRRVSCLDSAQSGLSPEAQTQTAKARWEYELRKLQIERTLNPNLPKIDYEWGRVGFSGTKREGKQTKDGIFTDLGISAFKKPLRSRPAGNRLDLALQRGDVLLFAHLDRAFRNLKDFVLNTERWTKRGVRIIFCNPDVDLTTPHGEAFAANAAVWAQLDSRIKSLKNREVAAAMKLMNRPVSRLPRLGWMRDPNHSKRLVPDNALRRLARRCVALRASGMSCLQISDLIESEQAAAEGRPMKARQENWDKETKLRKVTERKVKAYVSKWRAGLIEPPTDEPHPGIAQPEPAMPATPPAAQTV